MIKKRKEKRTMDKLAKVRADVEKLSGNPYYMMAVKDVLAIIDSLQEEPVSEDLFEASAEYAATGEILANGKEMIDFQKQKSFIAGAEWKKAKLPKWKNKPLGGGCWSGEISVDPIRRSYRYEHYIINADKLFKLLDKEE